MKKTVPKTTEKGVTLLESLVGIMVVAVVVSLITPALVVGYATRVQNYRTDQAIKLARGEIDRVRLEVERSASVAKEDLIKVLPPGEQFQAQQIFDLNRVDAPSGVSSTATLPSCPLLDVTGSDLVNRVCGADINGDGNWDLAMQTFRTATPSDAYTQAGSKPIAFLMGVRVYTRAALTASPSGLNRNPGRRSASLGLTSGQGLSLPLVSFYTPIVKSDLSFSRAAYCELTNRTNGTNGACN